MRVCVSGYGSNVYAYAGGCMWVVKESRHFLWICGYRCMGVEDIRYFWYIYNPVIIDGYYTNI